MYKKEPSGNYKTKNTIKRKQPTEWANKYSGDERR